MEMILYRVALAPELEPAFIGKRILIAEDEPLIALDLEDMLVRMGFSIAASVRDVASSLECLRSAPVDAAILDYRLGRDTADPVAAALMQASIPFILTTGLEPDASYPGATFLQKPYSFAQIKLCMAQLLAGLPSYPNRSPQERFQAAAPNRAASSETAAD